MNKAIFMDRDGTLIQEVGYLKMIEDLKFTFKATEALRLFHEAGFKNIVVTNQSAVARGMVSPKELNRIHLKLKALAKEEGATVDDILYCPHLPEGRVAPYNTECECRKPKPGMILRAAQKHKLQLSQCYVVGDKISDLELAKAAGIPGVLVLTGYGSQTRAQWTEDVATFATLFDFAKSLQPAVAAVPAPIAEAEPS